MITKGQHIHTGDTFLGVSVTTIRAFAEALDEIGGIEAEELVRFAAAYTNLRGSEGFAEQMLKWRQEADLHKTLIERGKLTQSIATAEKKLQELDKKLEGLNG